MLCAICAASAPAKLKVKGFLSLFCHAHIAFNCVSLEGGGKRAGKVKCLHLSLASYENSLFAALELPRAPFLLYCCAIYLMCCLANYAYARLYDVVCEPTQWQTKAEKTLKVTTTGRQEGAAAKGAGKGS